MIQLFSAPSCPYFSSLCIATVFHVQRIMSQVNTWPFSANMRKHGWGRVVLFRFKISESSLIACYQILIFHYGFIISISNLKILNCANKYLQVCLKQKHHSNKPQPCIRWQSENLCFYTLEESSIALCKFLSFRWQAARFRYSRGSLLFSRTARLYAFTAAR